MRILLDTHILLWASQGSRKLGSRARRIMMVADELFVSSASLWEMSIKASLGRLQIDWNLLLTGLRGMQVRETANILGTRACTENVALGEQGSF